MRTHDSSRDDTAASETDDVSQSPLRLFGPIHLQTATTVCWECHELTRVHALIASRLVDMGQRADEPCYVFGIIDPPAYLVDALMERTPRLRPVRWGAAGEVLTNHCEVCNAMQPSSRLHAEPEGPFFGKPAEGHFGPVLLLGGLGLQFAEYSS